MRHRQGSQPELKEVARFHEVVGIFVRNVCESVMQLMSAAKVREGNHARQQRDAAPPEIRPTRAAKMAMNAFVGHHGPEKDQVRSREDVDREVKIVLDR